MSFNTYFQEELSALRDLGREFSSRNPGLAPFLGTPGRDPDVERILEGFAFLTGRLRQKLDDELPEITHALFNLLWPNYLRPVPSCGIVQYSPDAGLAESIVVPRGTAINSVPVEGTACRFRTVYDVEVSPLKLTGLELRERAGRVVMALGFRSGLPLASLNLDRLRFFLAGENSLSTTLYFILLKKLAGLKVVVRDDGGEEVALASLGPEAARPVGFYEAESMLPYPSNTFPGYRILQEYFCFPEKFMFLEVAGLSLPGDSLPAHLEARQDFEIQFWMKEFPPEAERVQKENFQLFCTPAVNLFRYDSTPLSVEHRQPDYRIVPDPTRPRHLSVYSVERVHSWSANGRARGDYLPFESFEHGVCGLGEAENEAMGYYRLKVRQSLNDGGTETYIAIVRSGKNDEPAKETISMELICTNRDLPQKLGLGDLCRFDDDGPEHVVVRNITAITGSYSPPLGGDLPWRLISNMSLNYISLVDVEAFKSVISAYDFRALHDKRRARILDRTLGGLLKMDSESLDRIHRGLPIRGARTRLTVDQKAFVSEGDMYVFGSVINEFLTLYATVNSFHEFAVLEAGKGELYKWPARLGSQSI